MAKMGYSQRILRPGNLILAILFILLISSVFWGYSRIKGPIAEGEIQTAQKNAVSFQSGSLTVGQGQLLEINNYFFLGKVYAVQTSSGRENLISFITPDPAPMLSIGGQVEWVGLGNYSSSVAEVYPEKRFMDGEILSLERISPLNNSHFYCVVHSLEDDKVQRFIVDEQQLSALHNLNSVQVSYRSPGESEIQVAANESKIAKGYIVDLWLTTKIKSLELERNFDFATYPYYISVTPSANAKYTWTFYLTQAQRDEVKVGNMVEIQYNSSYPTSIKVLSQEADPQLLIDDRSDDTTEGGS